MWLNTKWPVDMTIMNQNGKRMSKTNTKPMRNIRVQYGVIGVQKLQANQVKTEWLTGGTALCAHRIAPYDFLQTHVNLQWSKIEGYCIPLTQEPQWMNEITDSTEPYEYCVFS